LKEKEETGRRAIGREKKKRKEGGGEGGAEKEGKKMSKI
jgi:hypothetical protein